MKLGHMNFPLIDYMYHALPSTCFLIVSRKPSNCASAIVFSSASDTLTWHSSFRTPSFPSSLPTSFAKSSSPTLQDHGAKAGTSPRPSELRKDSSINGANASAFSLLERCAIGEAMRSMWIKRELGLMK